MRRTARGVACAVWMLAMGAGFAVVAGASMDGGTREPGVGGNGAVVSPPGASVNAIRYDRDIRPLLSDRCFKCHGPDAGARRAELRLDQPGAGVIVAGDAEGSELWKRINATDVAERMPPEGSNKRALSAEEKELVRRWIAEGAKYEKHWSFVAPERGGVPGVKDWDWCRNEIDRFVLARLEREAIAPSPEADPETLVRRVFLDLTGLPPTPEEVDAYLREVEEEKSEGKTRAGKPVSRAYERLVDRLLTREPYRSRTAERMATPWMDAARYADTCGIHTDNGRQMWAWRDWVLGAFRDNMPFDRFATEQLAGDLIPNATMKQKVASGFNRNHVTTDEGGAIAEEYLVEYAVDRAATTATTFLGLTMGCARCHDHKFDPISNEEFYRFFAYFNSIDEPGLYSQTPDANRAHEPFMEVPTAEQKRKMDALAKEIAGLKAMQAKTTPAEDEEYARFMGQFARETGAAWAESPVVGAKAESAAKLSVQQDGSVLASGANPPTDVHEVVLRPSPTAAGSGDLRLVLLEALADASLPNGRVGRAFNGNAVLSGIEVESFVAGTEGKPETVKKHEIQWLWADLSQMNGDYRFTNLLVKGSGADRGWAADGHTRTGDRHLLLLLKDPIAGDGKTDVRVRLRYESVHAQHVFGRVRLTLGALSDATKLPTEMSNFWVAGPFPSTGKPNQYDEKFGPEEATSIDFTKKFGEGPQAQAWRYDANLKDGATVALPDGNNISFVGRLIVTPVARELPVSLGSDDGIMVFVNGKEAFRHQIDRGVAADQDKATLKLDAGVNTVVLKIVNTGGAAGYYFQEKANPDEAYPHDLVGALLPREKRGSGGMGSEEKIKQAWRVARSPEYRERAQKVEVLDKETGEIRAKVAKTMVMKELDMPRQTFVLTRGQYDQPDKSRPVTRGVPAFLGAMPASAPENRLGLAKWVMSKENPLPARVEVNRLWEMVFGAGLVRTSEDFGQQGEWPSHPELLDWLAVEFRESGWDVRHMVRMMVTSATYRQASTGRSELAERDPENRLLAKGPRRRLSAEQIRDQALYVSGLLVEKFGGPSVKPYQPEGIWKEGALPSSNSQTYERGKGEDLYRRSLYTYWKRAVPMPDMQAFDAPTREFCVVRRAATGTPLQALVLWNDPAFVEAARVLAARTMAEGGDDAAKIGLMFRRCTGHRAEAREMELLMKALAANRARYSGAPEDAAKLLMVGDAPVAEGADKAELAAWTMVAETVMNLYRVTTQE